VIYKLKLLLY